MKKISLSFFTLLFFSLSTFAQVGHSVKAKIKGAPEGKVCHLAHFHGYNQYIKVDSAVVKNGELNFIGKDSLKGGLYLVVLSPSKYYDFIIDGKTHTLEFESDTTDFIKNVKFKNSKENDILFGYRRFLQTKSNEAEAISRESAMTKDVTIREANRKKIDAIQKEVNAFMKETVAKNKGTFAAKVINANIEPEAPTDIPRKANGNIDSTYLFYHYKNRYFNNIDFSDARLIRSPFIHSKLERYFNDLVYQKKDSIIKDADKVLKKTMANNEVYRYALWYITNKYENSEIVGLDGVFIHLAENYYLKNASWLDSTQRAKFQERVNILKPLETGLKFPKLSLFDLTGKERTPEESTSKYTIVYFYSPDCGHCKDAAPKLLDFQNKNKNRATVYNISIDYDGEKLVNFINTYKLGDMINLWDYKGKYIFKNNFDVYSTPTSYVLDENKRIIAKRIPAEKLEDFINFYERQQIQKNSN